MTRILRSLIVLALLFASTTVAALGFFSSQVTVTANTFTTGTLRLAMDSTAIGDDVVANSAYEVAHDDGEGVTQLSNFPPIVDMQAGETRSVYVTVRNIGSAPFDYRANFSGLWNAEELNTGANATYLTVSNVTRFATGNCLGDFECEDIVSWLNSLGVWSHSGVSTAFGDLGSAVTGTSYFGHAAALSDGVNTLQPNQFAIFKVDFTLDAQAGPQFAGKTFTYSMNAQAKQTNANSF